ncbi:MAG: hypothetical protein NDI60_08135 [Elusimicrobiales bacterium]|nr:hypothetical protein [Elusimicrobiales bacterium]
MSITVLKAVLFLAGFFGLLWLGVLYGEERTPAILASVIGYVAAWQFLCARGVAEALTRHYHNTLLANFLPADKLIVTPEFVRGLAAAFFALSLAVWFFF